MDIEQINQLVEHPLPADPEETENHFFADIRREIHQIPYNQLRQINIPVGPANQLGDLVIRFGIEILAYYVPFHFESPRPWGIYLRRDGIAHVRQRIMQIAELDGHNFQNPEIPTNVAIDILLLHELRHHAIEVAFTRVELQNRTRHEYQHYIREKRNHNDLHNHTEAICNANVAKHHFKTDWQLPGIISPPNVIVSLDWNNYVREFMLGQPAGYNDFERFTGMNARRVLESLQLPIGLRLDARGRPVDLAQIRKEFNNHSQLGILNRMVPIHTD
jgi:hypothetical protein